MSQISYNKEVDNNKQPICNDKSKVTGGYNLLSYINADNSNNQLEV